MTHDPKPVVVQNTNWTTVVSIGAMTGIFIIFVLILWKVGFLSFRGDDPSSKVVAAALALVGGLVAAIGTIVGVLLKYSIDQRTESRMQIEADRANALQTQAEQRLNLEAAIRAVELLGAKEGADAPLQRAGALFALSSLDQHGLTLDLTAYLLEKKALEPAMACSLIDAALTRGDEAVRRQAVETLYENSEQMITELDTSAPRAIMNWDSSLNSEYVRGMAVLAMSRILLARPLQVWQSRFEGELYGALAALALAWQAESNDRDAAAILDAILTTSSISVIFHPNATVDLSEIKSQVAGVTPVSSGAATISERIRVWSTAGTLPT